MENYDNNAGEELVSILRHQRYLYHQMKLLTEHHQQLADTDSPEIMLEITNGRRKLIEKLQELNYKLRPIKANWNNLSSQFTPEQKTQANEMAGEVRNLVRKINTAAESAADDHLLHQHEFESDECLVETCL